MSTRTKKRSATRAAEPSFSKSSPQAAVLPPVTPCPHLKHLDQHSPSASSLTRSLQLSSREWLPDILQVRKKQKSSDWKPLTMHMEIHVSSGLPDGSNTTAPYPETNTSLSSWLSSDPTQKFEARPTSHSLAVSSCTVCKRAGRMEEQISLTWERHHFTSSCCPAWRGRTCFFPTKHTKPAHRYAHTEAFLKAQVLHYIIQRC